jgi:hypothetical protein
MTVRGARPCLQRHSCVGGEWRFELPEGGPEPLLKALLDGNAGIETLSIERPGLHDAFIAIAGAAAANEMGSALPEVQAAGIFPKPSALPMSSRGATSLRRCSARPSCSSSSAIVPNHHGRDVRRDRRPHRCQSHCAPGHGD